MLFLIEYSRSEARLVGMRAFQDADWTTAEDARLDLELERHREGIEHEIVILHARDEEAVHRTHGRYFPDFGRPAAAR